MKTLCLQKLLRALILAVLDAKTYTGPF